MNDPVIQYIIIRNDLDTMTPGRACAQAAHAASNMAFSIPSVGTHREWQDQTEQQFGTTIVLGASINEILIIRDALAKAWAMIDFRLINDPEYHVRDGDVTHLLPLDTCLWIMGRKSEIERYVSHLELY